jgi:hypothetical protein
MNLCPELTISRRTLLQMEEKKVVDEAVEHLMNLVMVYSRIY